MKTEQAYPYRESVEKHYPFLFPDPVRKKEAQAFARRLTDNIVLYHERMDGWVQTLGGRRYSDTMASSLTYLSEFMGKTGPADMETILSSRFPKRAHSFWRIITTIDDAVDTHSGYLRGPLHTIRDAEGVPLTSYINELSPSDGIRWIGKAATRFVILQTRLQEAGTARSFAQAVMAKRKTTGTIAKIGAYAAVRAFGKMYPEETLRMTFPQLADHAAAAGYIIQLADDLNDISTDLAYRTSSSLVIAAARDADELNGIKLLATRGEPLTIPGLLLRNLSTGAMLTRYYASARTRLVRAPPEMVSYFDEMFFPNVPAPRTGTA